MWAGQSALGKGSDPPHLKQSAASSPTYGQLWAGNLHPVAGPDSTGLGHLAWWGPGQKPCPASAGHCERLESQVGLVCLFCFVVCFVFFWWGVLLFCVLCFLISPPAWGGNKVVTVTQAVPVCLSCKLQAPPPTQICLNHSDLIPHRAYFHEGRESISEQEYSKCKIQADLASRLPRPYMGICPAQGQAQAVTPIGWARRSKRTDTPRGQTQ